MPMPNEKAQEQTVRLNLALQMQNRSIEELEEIFQWIMGPKQTILPVSSVKVIQNG